MAIARKHRSKTQWQELIEQWRASGLSARQFCSQQDIGYASFCQWRKRLSSPEESVAQRPEPEPSFIDLSALGSERTTGWNIVLNLGNGVELRLSQD